MQGFLRRECAALQVVPHCQQLVTHYFSLLVTCLEGHLVSGDPGVGGHPWVLGAGGGVRPGVWWRLVVVVAPQGAGVTLGTAWQLGMLWGALGVGDTSGCWGAVGDISG